MNANPIDHSTPDREKRLAREQAAFRYTLAVDRRDVATIHAVRKQARLDPELARIIEEINEELGIRAEGTRRRTDLQIQATGLGWLSRLLLPLPRVTLALGAVVLVMLIGAVLFNMQPTNREAPYAAQGGVQVSGTPTPSGEGVNLPPSISSGWPPIPLSNSRLVVIPAGADRDEVIRMVLAELEAELKKADTLPLQIQIMRPNASSGLSVYSESMINPPPAPTLPTATPAPGR